VAKPTKRGDKWRIRWLDERGERQSAVRDDYKVAQNELRRHQVEVEEIKRGIRNAPPPENRASAARRTTRASSAGTSAPASAICACAISGSRTATTSAARALPARI
jgi:hypothetical protein